MNFPLKGHYLRWYLRKKAYTKLLKSCNHFIIVYMPSEFSEQGHEGGESAEPESKESGEKASPSPSEAGESESGGDNETPSQPEEEPTAPLPPSTSTTTPKPTTTTPASPPPPPPSPKVIGQAPTGDGGGAVGADKCAGQPGQWSEWRNNGVCSADCGACGMIQRTRECLSYKNGEGCPCM